VKSRRRRKQQSEGHKRTRQEFPRKDSSSKGEAYNQGGGELISSELVSLHREEQDRATKSTGERTMEGYRRRKKKNTSLLFLEINVEEAGKKEKTLLYFVNQGSRSA